ncbi:MAG: hypothetical protein ACPHQB_08405 [Miltoncostaeaceae bacterium]
MTTGPYNTGLDHRSVWNDTEAWNNILDTYGEKPSYPSYGDPYAGVKAAHAADMWRNLGVAGGLQLAQTTTNLLPTAQDRRNKQELERLKGLEERDALGLTGKKRAHLERTMMDPVRAHAAQAAQQSAAHQAAKGGSMSAADANRAQREYRRDVQQGAIQAGHAINQAHLAEADRQLKEIESRTAYKSDVQKRRRAATSQAIGALAGVAGKGMAAQRVATMDTSGLAEAGVTPAELDLALKAAGGDQQRAATWLLLSGLR